MSNTCVSLVGLEIEMEAFVLRAHVSAANSRSPNLFHSYFYNYGNTKSVFLFLKYSTHACKTTSDLTEGLVFYFNCSH